MTDGATGPGVAGAPGGAGRWRPRRWPALGTALGLTLLGAGALAVVGGLPARAPVPAPSPDVVVLPSPTPTVAPIAREPRTTFADGLPATVLDHALSGFAEEPALLVAGALEAYRLDYSDGGGDVVTVLAGQWPTSQEAVAAFDWLTRDDLPLDDDGPASGDVVVDGAVAGTWVAGTDGAGAGTVTWTNGTVLLRATAVPDAVRDVHAAFPL